MIRFVWFGQYLGYVQSGPHRDGQQALNDGAMGEIAGIKERMDGLEWKLTAMQTDAPHKLGGME